jgi:hypothetical protein
MGRGNQTPLGPLLFWTASRVVSPANSMTHGPPGVVPRCAVARVKSPAVAPDRVSVSARGLM